MLNMHKLINILLVVIFAVTMNRLDMTTLKNISPEEKAFMNQVNTYRQGQGLDPLGYDPALIRSARKFGLILDQSDTFSHTAPDGSGLSERIDGAGVTNWNQAGENLAQSPSVVGAMFGLENSQSHRENMLDPNYTHMGVGVVKGNPTGMNTFVNHFIGYPQGGPNVQDPNVKRAAVTNQPGGNMLGMDNAREALKPYEVPVRTKKPKHKNSALMQALKMSNAHKRKTR